jgi:heme exporter protein D
MIDYGGFLWQAIGVGVIVLGVVIVVGLLAWRGRRQDSTMREVRDHATKRVYQAEEQERRRREESAARSPP